MDKLRQVLKSEYPDKWEELFSIMEKMIVVLSTYSCSIGEYHIGIYELSNYLYGLDNPEKISLAESDNPRLEGSYNYAVRFLAEHTEDSRKKEYIHAYNKLIKQTLVAIGYK